MSFVFLPLRARTHSTNTTHYTPHTHTFTYKLISAILLRHATKVEAAAIDLKNLVILFDLNCSLDLFGTAKESHTHTDHLLSAGGGVA